MKRPNALSIAQEFLRARLKASGISEAKAKYAGIRAMTVEAARREGYALPDYCSDGFLIPYHDDHGKILKHHWRWRNNPGARGGFSALTKQPRYAQPPKSGCFAYFSKVQGFNWPDVLSDPKVPLIITEGELKGFAALCAGLPTIGLGGVWNFANNRTLIREFELISWKERSVYICYDSDAAINADIAAAENTLARELLDRGGRPLIVRIPQFFPAQKTGIDDFLVQKGVEEFTKNVLEASTEWGAARALFGLNEEVVYARVPGQVIRLSNFQRMKPLDFLGHAFANRKHIVTEGKNTKLVSTAKEWLHWPQRAEVEQATYVPGQPRFTSGGDMNMWQGWGCEPKRGNIKPWVELLDRLFAGGPAQRKWVEQWLAYPIQHPGAKLFSAVLLWSAEQGPGKSTIGYSVQKIYGQNFREISDRQLNAQFNEWADSRQFLMGDEITGGGGKKKDHADRLKSLITQPELTINLKHLTPYVIPNCINFLFTSNHPDAFYIEHADRRIFVWEVTAPPQPVWFFNYYYPWLDSDKGGPALFDHLLHVDLTGFNPKAPAPDTAAKHAMREASSGVLRTWVSQLKESPDDVLHLESGPSISHAVVTARELVHIFNSQCINEREKENEASMGRALAAAGFRKVPRVRDLQDGRGGTFRASLWCVRSVPGDPVELRKETAVRDQYNKERGLGAKQGSLAHLRQTAKNGGFGQIPKQRVFGQEK